MAQITLKALILRANPATENDRYVKLLSSEYGLIEAFARGALRPKSPLLAATEAFSLCEFTIFTNKEKFYLNKANFVFPFAKLKKNIEALTAAAHLSDIAIDISQSLEHYEDVYQLMVYTFYALEHAADQGVEAILAVTHASEIRLLTLAGYALEFSPCPHCSLPLENISKAYFNFPGMQFVCETEARHLLLREDSQAVMRGRTASQSPLSQNSLAHPSWERSTEKYLGQAIWQLSADLVIALRYFSEAPFTRLFSFQISKDLEKELAAFTQAYLMANLEKNYKRLEFLFQLSGI